MSIDSLQFHQKGKKKKPRSRVLEGNPLWVSWDHSVLLRRGALCQMACCPFMLHSSLLSASWSLSAAVSWWRRAAAVVRQQYFNGSAPDSSTVCRLGQTTWANTETWKQVLISPRISICGALPVFAGAQQRPLESPLARMWRVYRRLSLRRINTRAHANSDTHSLCVSLSSQIRKHDIIFLSCVSVCARTGRNFILSVHAFMCPHVLCAVKTLMSYLSWWPFLLCWCPMFLWILSWYPWMCNYRTAATRPLY